MAKLDRGSERIGVTPAGRDDAPTAATAFDVTDPHSFFFTDGREGADRWGRERAGLTACGTGWDSYACAAFVEESCPGARNPGDRIAPEVTTTCSLDCGVCGGGGRPPGAMGYQGQEKGQPMFDAFIAEMGGSLRLDRWTARPAAPAESWPAPYFPVVEAYVKSMDGSGLHRLPMIGTTAQTAFPGRVGRRPSLLRDRLGGYQGKLALTGLVKDNLLDDVWDDLPHYLRYARASDVDVMVVPQVSYYHEWSNAAALFNSNRIFSFYCQCMDLGFPHVALDVPPFAARWLHDEFLDFAVRNQVKLIACSLQTFGTRGALDPRHVIGARRIHEALPSDVAVMIFGVGQRVAIAQLLKIYAGRRVVFADKAPYAQSIFFQLMPFGNTAPPGMSKGEVFRRNVEVAARQVEQMVRPRVAKKRRA